MREPLLIGVDLGTTQVKATAFDLRGRARVSAAHRYPTIHRSSGHAEQDPDAWWGALEQVFAQLASRVELGSVVAVGVCSQVNTHVFVSAEGRALRPAISWQDQRCADIAAELSSGGQNGHRPGLQIDASNLLARAEWLRRQDPTDWAMTRWILSPKDYINLRLTGQAATDGLSSIGLVDAAGQAYLELDRLIDGVLGLLPPLKDPIEPVGATNGNALGLPAGVPVAVATMDAWGSVYGSGMTGNGQGMEISGTSEILGVIGNSGRGAPGVVGFPPYRGLRLFAGPTQAGGDALRWFGEAHGRAVPWVLMQAERSSSGAEGMVFLPHLAGERAPLWDPNLRGAFVGLDLRHSLPDMCRAVLEGVAFSARQLLEALEEAAGLRPASLALTGGGARSELWSQIKADVLGLPLARLEVLDSGVLGAALMAGVAGGELGSLEEAAQEMVRTERVFEPRTENRDAYETGYQFYRQAQGSLQTLFRERASATPTVLVE